MPPNRGESGRSHPWESGSTPGQRPNRFDFSTDLWSSSTTSAINRRSSGPFSESPTAGRQMPPFGPGFTSATRIDDKKAAADAREALAKLRGGNGNAVLLCDAAMAKGDGAPREIERLVAAFGSSPLRSDACLALARLDQLVGKVADAGRMMERASRLSQPITRPRKPGSRTSAGRARRINPVS